MIEEVQALLKNGVPAERLIRLGLEYRYCTLYLLKESGYEEMKEKLRGEIHRFAKRQMTWFRGMERRGMEIHWINGDLEKAASALIDSSETRLRP
jgi:tRNA dimethylallyltransferase